MPDISSPPERTEELVEFDDGAGIAYTITKLREELAELYARPIDENAEKGRRTAIYQKGPSIIGRLQHIDHLQRYQIACLEHQLAKALNPPKHRYWGAGEPDCPRDIKAGNGELHTLRCKVCGQDNPRDDRCYTRAALQSLGYAEMERENARLRSALGRLDRNFDLLLAGKPVRDVAETKAETRTALRGDQEQGEG